MDRRVDQAVTIAPYLLLGPVSGFLIQMIRRNIEARRPVLASLYAVLLGQFTLFLGVVAEKVLLPG